MDIVSGDFDSITDRSMQKAKEQGASIINTHDQDETDFTKSVRVLSKYCASKKIKLKSIFVICQSSGRIDQIMANVDTLFKCFKLEIVDPQIAVHLFSHDSFTWLLQSGRHKICIPDSLKMSKNAWCGLIPVGETCSCITTTGLKWNLNKNAMAFGSLISTSNTFDGSDFVTIDNESPLLWCMGILPIFHDICGTLDEEQ
ncbi:thiamine pyrophosphokinase 1-like [Arctopsyche grandis]|uniref:thiamine pyrophosphokinase 1-like n=1 Tax=Arctopsyche grandis TaxID=121162 RepID=UPI00406DA3C0